MLVVTIQTHTHTHHTHTHARTHCAVVPQAPRTLLLTADNPEPTDIVISLDVGLQWALEDRPTVPRRVLLLSGPMGVGKSSIAGMLMKDFPSKLAAVAPLTTAEPCKGEADGAPYTFMPAEVWEVWEVWEVYVCAP